MKTILVAIFLILINQIYTLKIDKILEETLTKNGEAQVFVNFKNHVDFKQLEKGGMDFDSMDHIERGRFVVNTLKKRAEETQKEMISFLKERNIEYHAFWITNTIVINQATLPLLESLEKTFFTQIELFELVGEDKVEPITTEQFNTSTAQTIEAGVTWVNAPNVWRRGFKGKGITVGVIDTGAFLHNDLRNTYRGRRSGHDYNWYDALNKRTAPYDDNFHGTHCHGTIGASSNEITVGVAPESEWISCKYLSSGGSGSVADCIKCMEFMLAPTTVTGTNPNPDVRPELVSNSYGGSDNVARRQALDAMLAGGVEMVYAAGNSGGCNTIGFPARYDDALAVGALNRLADTIASFSSKGPGLNGRLKPEVSAPGASVSSTSNTGGYRVASGTSMACPHVAGAIALLWSAHPNLKRKIKETRKLFYDTAKKQTSNLCNSVEPTPNNVFGHGTIDCEKAVLAARENSIVDDIVKL